MVTQAAVRAVDQHGVDGHAGRLNLRLALRQHPLAGFLEQAQHIDRHHTKTFGGHGQGHLVNHMQQAQARAELFGQLDGFVQARI